MYWLALFCCRQRNRKGNGGEPRRSTVERRGIGCAYPQDSLSYLIPSGYNEMSAHLVGWPGLTIAER